MTYELRKGAFLALDLARKANIQTNVMKTFGCSVTSAVAILALSAGAQATPITIDFESDPTGPQANGFSSADASGVTFADTSGSDLRILAVAEGDGKSLVVPGDLDLSALLISFDSTIDYLELAFGGDNPLSTNAGDLAQLTLFLGASEIGQVSVALNRDSLMNQVIDFGAIGGALLFDSAIFGFTDPFGNLATGGGAAANIGATEVVDNIMFNTVDDTNTVPEPSSLTLLLLGLSLMLIRQRSKFA